MTDLKFKAGDHVMVPAIVEETDGPDAYRLKLDDGFHVWVSFAALAAIFRDEPDDMPVYRPARGPEITLGDLRKARAALARAKGAS